tara:strand:+ start:55 stop:612 length:558 start_codon:yes stop_codon:yes gene_type:complete
MALTRVKKVPTANLVQGSSFLTTASTITTSNMPAGTIIQVVRNVGATEYSTTSNSTYLNIADINTSITPKAANSILFFQISGQTFINGVSNGQSGLDFILKDHTNSTTKEQFRGINFHNVGSSGLSQVMDYFCFNFTESASNTNAREYRLEYRIEPSYNNCSTATIGWNDANTSPQCMVIYEIAQ